MKFYLSRKSSITKSASSQSLETLLFLKSKKALEDSPGLFHESITFFFLILFPNQNVPPSTSTLFSKTGPHIVPLLRNCFERKRQTNFPLNIRNYLVSCKLKVRKIIYIDKLNQKKHDLIGVYNQFLIFVG